MLELKTKVRAWGNSLGLTLPKNAVKQLQLHKDQEVKVLIMGPINVLQETFGMLKGKIKKSSQQLKDEARAELYND